MALTVVFATASPAVANANIMARPPQSATATGCKSFRVICHSFPQSGLRIETLRRFKGNAASSRLLLAIGLSDLVGG